MRILVAQMTRMGDMLQTSTLVRAIKTRWPEAHITAMVRRMGKSIAQRHPDVDDVLIYEEEQMFLDLRSGDSDKLLRAYNQVEDYVRQINEGHFNLAYNCTHSLGSGMLLKFTNIPEVVGAHLSDDGQFILRGKWTNYFFTSIFQRQYSDINLCDVFRNLMDDAPLCQELVFEVTDDDRREVDEILDRHGVGPDDFVACFQLGASDEEKRWPVQQFADLARRMGKTHNAKIFLVGVKDEAPLGEELLRNAPGAAHALFGQTSIPQLAALLERSKVLVTNDTGTMHIAAAVKCPIVLLSVGYVHFRETGPFGAGHCAVERRRTHISPMDRSHESAEKRGQVRPEQVLRIIDLALATLPEGPLPQWNESPDLADIDLYHSRFAPDGLLEWYPVIRRPLAETDFLRIAFRAMWLEHLNGPLPGTCEADGLAQMLGCYDLKKTSEVQTWCDTWTAVFAQLAHFAEEGIAATEGLLELLERRESMREAHVHVQRLMQLDEDTRLFGELHPPCKPLITIARFERDNLEGADPLLLAQTTRDIYRVLHQRAVLFHEKLGVVAGLCLGR